jgi:membrane fusion protein (multidrug efflux system)
LGTVTTDDAYVRADLAPLSTKVAGTVAVTHVNDFDSVKAGQPLVQLKNDDFKARVDQAAANVQQAQTKLADMKQRKQQQDARIVDAQSALDTAHSDVKQTDDSIVAAGAAIDEARAGISAAGAAIVQADAATKAAQADATRTSLERARQEALLADESSTHQKVEQAVDDSDRAAANVAAQKAAQAKAKAELAARRAELSKAKQQLSSSQQEKQKSISGVTSRESELTEQKKQRELLDGEEKELAANLAASKAALTSAQVDLDYTNIKAPQDGVVGELKVKPGQLVSAGTQVITLISATPWILANYRETQLQRVRKGDRVQITVDALPSLRLKGHVEAIAPASGAQFSLLPPDNASGNFTKITQRIPVKIVFDEHASNLARLRPGMSVITTIEPTGNP